MLLHKQQVMLPAGKARGGTTDKLIRVWVCPSNPCLLDFTFPQC